MVKTMREQGWFLTNPRLGAPHGMHWFDFPLDETLHMVLLKAAVLFTPSYGLALNLVYLLGYFLVTYTGMGVLRYWGLSWPAAVAGGLLYAFTPYHMRRAEGHFFLSSYFLIPLTSMAVVWVATGKRLWEGRRPTRIGWYAVAICFLTGCAGIYYAFFAMIFLLAAGFRGAGREWSLRGAFQSAGLVAVVVSAILLSVSPSLVYRIGNGTNSTLAVRSPGATEILGMRVFRLLLPVSDHRVPYLANISRQAPPQTEADVGQLGAVASAGLLILLVGALTGFPAWKRREEVLTPLSAMAVLTVLTASVGGLGTVIAYLVTAQIRAYNRISVYLAFFCLAAFFLVLERALEWLGARAWAIAACSAAVLFAGFLDQAPPPETASFQANEARFRGVGKYMDALERRLPSGSMILQMPYLGFIENGPVVRMFDYDPGIPYLQSSTLRWSYGAPRGRYGDDWAHKLGLMGGPKLVETAALAGYAGILVDRFGYEKPDRAIEDVLRGVLQAGPFEDETHRYAFYDLASFTVALKAKIGDGAWAAASEAVVNRVEFRTDDGCSVLEGNEALNWRWCSERGAIIVDNPGGKAQTVELVGGVVGAGPEMTRLALDGLGVRDRVKTAAVVSPFREVITAPPGRSELRFDSDGKPHTFPGDLRRLVFRFENLALRRNDGVEAVWGAGCYGVERDAVGEFRWCGPSGAVTLRKEDGGGRVLVSMSVEQPNAGSVAVEWPGGREEIRGGHYVGVGALGEWRLSSSAAPITAPGDARKLVYRVRDFHVTALPQ